MEIGVWREFEGEKECMKYKEENNEWKRVGSIKMIVGGWGEWKEVYDNENKRSCGGKEGNKNGFRWWK